MYSATFLRWGCLRALIWFVLLTRSALQVLVLLAIVLPVYLYYCRSWDVFTLTDCLQNIRVLSCYFSTHTALIAVILVRTGLHSLMILSLFLLGIEESECRDVQDVLTGLWLDCFSFFLITLQMIMTDTDYGDEVQQQLLKKEAAAEK